MGAFGDTVTLVNRTSKTLIPGVRFDGREYPIEPGENSGFPKAWVPFAKSQNKLLGSQQPFNPTAYISLVGVKDTKDDCSPIEQSNEPQCLDRSGDKRRGRRSKVIEADGPTPFDAQMPGAIDGFNAR